jgi:hypothetical protein
MADVHETLIELQLTTARNLAARTGQAIERVYAQLVHLEANGLAEMVKLTRSRAERFPPIAWAPVSQSQHTAEGCWQ